MIEVEDKKYPLALKEALKNLVASSGPKKLYYKGTWHEDIFKQCLAVVGSRHLTSYGRRATEQIVGEIAASGITIVSGFMFGGDEAAHSAAVHVGGKTIAVMPCGVDVVFPPQNKKLYQEILDNNGLIISEYESNISPALHTFVQRDRIVAGLSKAVFVTEAALESGSLVTANYAKKFGKKIFALPGQITSELSKGTLKLIKEGAEAVGEARDILTFYKVLAGEKKPVTASSFGTTKPLAKSAEPASLESKIIEQLRREPMKADDMARMFLVPVAHLGTTLTMMQLKGFINLDNGKYYIN